MQIVKPEIMQAAEEELISSIISSLDELQVAEFIQKNYGFLLKEKMHFKGGEIVAYNNQIAIKLDYKSAVNFFLLVDEIGKFSGLADPNISNSLREEISESNYKIVDSEIIKTKRDEFFNSLSVAICNKSVTKLFINRYQPETVEKIIYKKGEIIVFNDHVTYQFLYEADITLSILIDRKGNCIKFSKENHGMTLKAEELWHEFTN